MPTTVPRCPPTSFQATLFGDGEPTLVGGDIVRIPLDAHSWIDHGPGWLAGADTLFAHLLTTLAWRSHRRPMYGALVDEPRLGSAVEAGSGPGIVTAIIETLAGRYGRRLDAVWANYYRDGRDSVAWHADRVGRHRVDPLVAIVSLGGPRRFSLRPRDAPGHPRRFVLASGDLLVMGGACQHAWEHAVPKMAHAHPRISLTFREPGPGVRGTGARGPATRA